MCNSGSAQVSVLTRRGGGSVIDVDQLSTTVGDFVTLWFIWGCALGPVEASALGVKASSPEGKAR